MFHMYVFSVLIVPSHSKILFAYLSLFLMQQQQAHYNEHIDLSKFAKNTILLILLFEQCLFELQCDKAEDFFNRSWLLYSLTFQKK